MVSVAFTFDFNANGAQVGRGLPESSRERVGRFWPAGLQMENRLILENRQQFSRRSPPQSGWQNRDMMNNLLRDTKAYLRKAGIELSAPYTLTGGISSEIRSFRPRPVEVVPYKSKQSRGRGTFSRLTSSTGF